MRNFILFLALVPHSALAETNGAPSFYVTCTPMVQEPYFSLEPGRDINSDDFRVWYTIGFREFRLISFEHLSEDLSSATQLLHGEIFDMRGRKTYAENKETGETHHAFYVYPNEWDCSLYEN